jgi:6-phosphogluconolactonase (cycloisomerase 2 family)
MGVLASLAGLTGCPFFVCEGKADCGTGGSTTVTGNDFAYVSNSTTGSTYISGYSLQSGNLSVPTTGSPYQLNFVPSAMAITPDDTLMFIGSAAGPEVYAYSIASDGAISILNSQAPVANELATSIAISPDGNYIFFANANTLAPSLDEYTITAGTGILTLKDSIPFSDYTTTLTPTPMAVAISPNSNYVACTLKAAGTLFLPYDAGVLSTGTLETPASTGEADYGLAIDINNYAYVGRTDGLAVFSVTAAGVPSAPSSTLFNVLGSGPQSAVVNSSNQFVYFGNYNNSTISVLSTYSASSGVTQLETAVSGPTSVYSIGTDNTGKYILANGMNSTEGTQLFTIESSGDLSNAVATAATGSNTISVMALTH